MATARATANVVVQPLFNVPLHMKAIIDDINIDNQSGVGITVQLQDTFTQDISQTNNIPTVRNAFPLQATVPANTNYDRDVNSVGAVECIGNVGVICNAIQAACVIVVSYHFE